ATFGYKGLRLNDFTTQFRPLPFSRILGNPPRFWRHFGDDFSRVNEWGPVGRSSGDVPQSRTASGSPLPLVLCVIRLLVTDQECHWLAGVVALDASPPFQ